MIQSVPWTTPADIKRQLLVCWNRGRILAARIEGTPLFPLALRFKAPDAKAPSSRFDDVRRWIKTLEQGSKPEQGFGYEIGWNEINHRQLGRNRVPSSVQVAREYDALRLIGKHNQAEAFSALADVILGKFSVLRAWIARYPLRVLAHASAWECILAVLTWFRDHPQPGVYLRQIDIAGIDTKFIESHKSLLSELLDQILPPQAVATSFSPGRSFEQRYGLACKPPLVRFRLLDQRLAIQGLTDMAIPAADFCRLQPDAKRVFITENEINGLAFPQMRNSLVIFGLGYGLDRLTEVEWLKSKILYYWGDIDTHGFAILDRLRAAFPAAQSFLMDRQTLTAHYPHWSRESERYDKPLQRLTEPECELFEALRRNVLRDHVRLEQERIGFGWVKQVLTRILDNPF
jgi:hypothetical protein